MRINEVVNQYKDTANKLGELSKQLTDYFSPIIQDHIEQKEVKELHKLLDYLPDCIVKLEIYQGLREIEQNS